MTRFRSGGWIAVADAAANGPPRPRAIPRRVFGDKRRLGAAIDELEALRVRWVWSLVPTFSMAIVQFANVSFCRFAYELGPKVVSRVGVAPQEGAQAQRPLLLRGATKRRPVV
jgi:hypothetical protein